MDAKVIPASMEQYEALIERDFPNFNVKELRYLGSGWDNAAILVNGQYVFRFPRGLFENSERLKTDEIEKEVSILDFLQGRVSFSVPKPDFVAPGFKYFGYKILQGTLWDHLENQFSDDLLKSWIKIRCELNKAITEDEAQQLKIPRYRTEKNEKFVRAYLADKSADPRVKGMVGRARDYVLEHLKNNARWHLIHEDLQMSNCFVDSDEHKITGVIDFFEAELGPIEAEFYFWSKWGRGMLEKMAKLQEEYDGTKIDVRLAEAIHQFYIVADYVEFKERGLTASAQHKWRQIEKYL